MTIGEKIVMLRERRGWKTNRLADEAGISQSNLVYIERDRRMPKVDTLEHICDALGLSLREFFSIESSPDESDRERIRELLEDKSEEYVKRLALFLEET